jgi:hypothetical protein
MSRKSGHRFPACAKPWLRIVVLLDASAGVGRSGKDMRNQKLRMGLRRAHVFAPDAETDDPRRDSLEWRNPIEQLDGQWRLW